MDCQHHRKKVVVITVGDMGSDPNSLDDASVGRCTIKNVLKLSHRKTPTAEARSLKKALEDRGVKVYVELHDGFKTIDLAIPKAKINVEVDGIQHLIDPKQILADLGRGYYSHKNGYDTMHIQNEMVRRHLDEIADALAEASKVRERKIHVLMN